MYCYNREGTSKCVLNTEIFSIVLVFGVLSIRLGVKIFTACKSN